jgi:serine/threonine-protein kinase RsbW
MEKEKIRTINLSIDSSLENVAMIGTSIYNLLRLFKFSKIQSNRIEVAVVECVTNAIRHSYNNQPGHPVELVFSYHPQLLTIDIINFGKPIDRSKINPVLNFDPRDLRTIPQGGMGLYLIYRIMDKVIINTKEGRSVWRLIKTNCNDTEKKE